MNKIKVFFGTASMILTIAAIAATKVGAVAAPEYYINDAGICSVAPQPTWCAGGVNPCLIIISGQTGTKQIFDVRTPDGTCSIPLGYH